MRIIDQQDIYTVAMELGTARALGCAVVGFGSWELSRRVARQLKLPRPLKYRFSRGRDSKHPSIWHDQGLMEVLWLARRQSCNAIVTLSTEAISANDQEFEAVFRVLGKFGASLYFDPDVKEDARRYVDPSSSASPAVLKIMGEIRRAIRRIESRKAFRKPSIAEKEANSQAVQRIIELARLPPIRGQE